MLRKSRFALSLVFLSILAASVLFVSCGSPTKDAVTATPSQPKSVFQSIDDGIADLDKRVTDIHNVQANELGSIVEMQSQLSVIKSDLAKIKAKLGITN